MTSQSLKKAGIVFVLTLQALMGPEASAASSQPVTPPHFSKAFLEIEVARSAEMTWARIGKFCDINSWLDTPCEIISGDDSEVGAVRSLMGGSYVEVLTSQTRYSYAYAALDMKDSLQKFIHGAVEVRPTSKNRSKILYTLIYDDTQVADQADRNIDLERRSAFIRKGLRKMKEIAERR